MSPIRVFRHWLPAHTVVQLALDLVLLPLALVLTVAWLSQDDWRSIAAIVPYALLAGVIMVAVHAWPSGYRPRPPRAVMQSSRQLVLWTLLAAPVAYGMAPQAGAGREALVLLVALGIIVAMRSPGARAGYDWLLSRRVMVVGTGEAAAEIAHALGRSGSLARVVGFYPAREDGPVHVARELVLTDQSPLTITARRFAVDEIIVAVRERRAGAVSQEDLLACKLAGVRVFEVSDFFEHCLRQVHLGSLRASWLVFGDGFYHGRLRAVVKRAFDLTAAVLLFGVIWPLMLVSAVLIMLESGWPVFYRQERVGRGNRPFHVIKFRSMRIDAERDGTPLWAAHDDPRTTRVGRLLRRLRIDELPQLWNVLTGDMSFVGPRPERPYFVARLTREVPFYAARHSIKPGLTGWAQVRYSYGRSVDDAAQKLQYDLYYVKNHSLFLDTVIVLATVGVILTGAGAR